jgi:hypothetical protein
MPVQEMTELTVEVYAARRQQIEDQALAMQERVDAYRDQELARLFVQCGWTQPRIAEQEGKTQQWVDYRLRFGRFLQFTTSGCNLQKPPKNLTERRFRAYFERTEGSKEQVRFAAVLKAMEEDLLLPTAGRDMEVSDRIIERYADGKWHNFETIVAGVESDSATVKTRLRFMKKLGTKNVFCESRKAGRGNQYRIVRGGRKKIQLEALQREIGPLLDELERQGKQDLATMSPPTVLELAHRIRRLLDNMAR